MIGNLITFTDRNGNELRGRVLDKILHTYDMEFAPVHFYLCRELGNNVSRMLLVLPSSIVKVA
jgi:hypothetical protein